MKALARIPFILFLAILALFPPVTWAETDWSVLSEGHRSYVEELGPAFYESVPVINVSEGSRLVLFSKTLARALGLETPEEFQKLQELVLKHAAWIVDQSGSSQKEFIATRYLDSGKKAPGEAMGDGRGLWIAEIPIELADGRFIFVDAFIKGSGQTPLAWFNHKDPDHKDGWQSLGEAVHAFLLSEVNIRNQLNSTGDLAVIELPFSKYDKRSQREMKSAITVRVGNQTRIAHFRYFADEPENFKKLTDFIIRRDLGLPRGTTIGKPEAIEYLRMLAMNLAEEAAYYHDLHAVHTSPTAGNRTTKGATIDLGTFIYLDAHHVNYTYLHHKYKLLTQTRTLKNYLSLVVGYMAQAKYEHAPSALERVQLQNLFEQQFAARLQELMLARLGLDSSDIAKLPDRIKKDFVNHAIHMSEEQGSSHAQLHGQEIKPAAYDMRQLLAGSLDVYQRTNGNSELQPWIELLTPKRSWATKPARDIEKAAVRWRRSIATLVSALPNDAASMERRTKKAQMLAANPRLDQSKSFFRAYDLPIIQAIERGERFENVEAIVEKAVSELTDQGMIKRTDTNTGVDRVPLAKPRPSLNACEAAF